MEKESPSPELSIVETLHKTKSPYDLMLKGKTLHFQIGAHQGGVLVSYTEMVPQSEMVPSFVHQMMPKEDRERLVERIVANAHFKLKWWEKFLGLNYERKIKKWVKARKKDVDQVHADEKLLESVKAKLEI